MQTAVDHPHIPVTTNPCAGIKLPTGEHTDDDPDGMVCLTLDELAILWAEVPDYWKPLILTLYGTGMRWGEGTALQAKHVDLPKRRRASRARQTTGSACRQPEARRKRLHLRRANDAAVFLDDGNETVTILSEL